MNMRDVRSVHGSPAVLVSLQISLNDEISDSDIGNNQINTKWRTAVDLGCKILFVVSPIKLSYLLHISYSLLLL